jgi:hypothetical protein
MKINLHRRTTFLCLSLLTLATAGYAQEDGAPLADPEPAPNINPEHFKFLLIVTAVAIVVGIGFVIVRSFKREKQKRADIISQVNKAHKGGDLLEHDYEELKKGLDPLNYEWLVKAFSIALTNKRRHNYLYSKYPKETAKDLFEYKHWIGMSIEQLIDSRGHAQKTQDDILQTKTVKVLTYKTSKGEENFSFVKGILEEFSEK